MKNLLNLEPKLRPGREYREAQAYILWLREMAIQWLGVDDERHLFYWSQLYAYGLHYLEELGIQID